jgi:hypothetical protein
VWHPDTALAGEQRDVGLVFDLAQPREEQVWAGFLVDDEPVELGEELRVGFVAADDLDPQPAEIVVRVHEGRALRLEGAPAQVAGLDAEVGECPRDLDDAGASTR